jgi:serine/threonine protein kinase
MEGQIVGNGKFRVVSKIGKGSFGEVYSGIDLKTGREVAVKVEPFKLKFPSQLKNECKMYRIVNENDPDKQKEKFQWLPTFKQKAINVGIPEVKTFVVENNQNILVMDRLGYSIEYLHRKCGGKFSLKTVAMLAEQMIERVELLHFKEIIHRDIKPDNFLMGIGEDIKVCHMIDFGLCKQYTREGLHIPFVAVS